MADLSRPVLDWERAEGKRCDECAHGKVVDMPPIGHAVMCDRVSRAAVVVRAPGGSCGPTATQWRRR